MSNSLMFFDGFDEYTSLSQKYDTSSQAGTFAIVSSTVRTGTQSMECSGSNGNARIVYPFANKAEIIVGMAVYWLTTVGSEQPFILFADSTAGQYQMQLTWDASGNLRVRRGGSNTALGTLLGTGSTLITLNTWHYIEFHTKINSSTGTVDVWLDGTNILTLTGQNTQNSVNAFVNQFVWGANGGPVYFIDDFYVMDPTGGGLYSTHLGDVKMLPNYANGNGTLNNFTNVFASYVNGTAYVVGQTIKDSNNNVQRCTTAGTATTASPTWATTGGSTTSVGGGCVFTVVGVGSNPGAQNWMAISEHPPDDDSSYVTDSTPGDIDRYVFPSIAGSAVKAVGIVIRAEKDDAGTRTIRAAVKSGGTSSDNGSDFTLTLNSYSTFLGIFETDPNTSVAWTVSGVNAGEYGVKTTT